MAFICAAPVASNAFIAPATHAVPQQRFAYRPTSTKRKPSRLLPITTCLDESEPTPESTPTPSSADNTSLSSVSTTDSVEEKPKPPFEIRGFSLANAFLFGGAFITITSFSSYFNSSGTASATSLGFVYGVPVLLVGCALKYAELQPIPVESMDGAADARVTAGTDTQKQIYKDITRHRYGDEAHLSSAMSSLGLIPRGEACPVLERARERSVENGEYELELEFYSVATPFKSWIEKSDKYDRFFGPNVSVAVKKVDAEKRLVALVITSVPVTKEQEEGTE